MRDYQSEDIRNIALVGHGACGKTMICESMLACGKLTTRLGKVSNQNTMSDYHEEEHTRQISIYTSLFNFEWKSKKINLLDTPGYADFIGDALGAVNIVDMAAITIHAAQGIELGTEKISKYATSVGLPKIIILTGLDKENTSYEKSFGQIREYFGNKVFPMTLPLNVGPEFNKILDILQKKIIQYNNDETGSHETFELTDETKNKAEALYAELSESIAESDDILLEKFFEKGSLTETEMLKGMKTAIKNGSLIPLFCVSGETNVGVTSIMDFIAQYGIAPTDRENIKGKDDHDNDIDVKLNAQNPIAYIFKTVNEARAGDLSLFRVFSGSIKSGLSLYNGKRSSHERTGQIFTINGKNRTQVEKLNSGDIGAIAKLKDTHTNNTLTLQSSVVTLPPPNYPAPSITSAVKPKEKGDEEKMSLGLSATHEEDPTFVFKMDPELHQMLIAGQGELHLNVCVAKLKRRFNLEINMLQPKIPYRETIKMKSDSKYRHKKQSGGAGQFAEVWMRIEPKQHDAEVEFTQTLAGQNVDRVFVPSVEKGVKTASSSGALAGYKIVGVKVEFYDGKQHPVDSKDIAFQIAGKFAFRQAFMAAKPCLLEPILNVTVKIPDEFMGDVMSSISSRRGKILGMDSEGEFQLIKAQAPQAELYRYATTLQSITGGRGLHTEEFSHYEEMPRELEQKVVEASKKEKEEEK
jgi:elongation factor G